MPEGSSSQQLVRLPWSWPYNPRAGDTTKDSRRVNVLDEKSGDKTYTLKRPGSVEVASFGAGTGQGVTVWNGELYAVVGDNLKTAAATPTGADGGTWVATSNGPWNSRRLFQAFVANNVLFVIGGIDSAGNALNDVWSIQPGQGWKLCTAAAPWTARYSFMTGVIGSTIYVIGGSDSASNPLGDVWSSQDGSSWTQETALMSAANWGKRFAGGSISADNGIYIFGGKDATSTVANDVAFSTDGKTWAQVTAAAGWSAREFMSSWYYQNRLIIAGGQSLPGTTSLNDVWSSNDGGKTWVQLTAAAFVAPGVTLASATVYANRMWLVNGYNGTTLLHRVYSSTDGVTWSVATTSGPWNASAEGQLIVFQTATAISAFHYQTMYWLGGTDNSGTLAPSSVIYYAALNTQLNASTAISPPVAGQPFQFNSFSQGTQLLVKNESGLWVLSGGVLIPVTDIGYPVETVPGLVVLGDFAYVMDPSGLIRNCNLNDPFHWPMLNAVGADYEADNGIAIAKYLNYLVVFGQYTIQFFYDAGVAVGSPLLSYLSGNMKIGAESAASVVQVGPTIAWVSRDLQLTRQVMIFNGLQPQVISTPAVEKIINGAGWASVSIAAYCLYANGHLCYVLYPSTNLPAWCYDFSTKEWFEWTRADSLTAPLAYAANTSTLDSPALVLEQGLTDGKVYTVDMSYTTDNNATFTALLITGKVDAGNNYRKFWGPITVIGDRNASTPSISWTDDDYASFSSARTVNMNTAYPQLFRCGQAQRRAFKYTQTDNQPMRLEALEAVVEQGGM